MAKTSNAFHHSKYSVATDRSLRCVLPLATLGISRGGEQIARGLWRVQQVSVGKEHGGDTARVIEIASFAGVKLPAARAKD